MRKRNISRDFQTPRQMAARILIGIGLTALVIAGMYFYVQSMPERFIREKIRLLDQIKSTPKVDSESSTDIPSVGLGKVFKDGSWVVGACDSESSGDTLNAAVLMTSNHVFFVTKRDVDGYEGWESLLFHDLNPASADELEKKISSLGDWERRSRDAR